MFYLLYLAWLFVSVSATCSDGSFQTNNNNECAYYCYDTQTYTTDYSQLTFAQISDDCYDTVRYGLKFGYCSNGLADLVYPDANDNNGCCPYCKCTTQDTTGTKREFERPVRKECYSCTCDTISGTTELGYKCDILVTVNDAYNWNDFECAAQTCIDDIGSTSGDTYYPGEGYFKNKDADEMCTEYCYCGRGGQETCVTGFNNILTSTNDGLKGSFLDENSYEIRDCIDEPTRIFTTDTGTYCSNWPNLKCSCPTGKAIGDAWFTEYPDRDGGFSSIGCAKCECKDGANYGGTNYAECDSLGDYRAREQCTDDNIKEIMCHNGDGYEGCSSCDAKTVSGQTVQPMYCGTTEPEAYCSWQFDNDNNDPYWNWGCNSFLCGAYGDRYENKCMMSQYSVTYTDCNGVEKTESGGGYQWCCKGTDNCNFVDIDITNCEENTDLSGMLQKFYECSAEAETDMFDDDCNDFEYQEITCSSIKELFKDQAICYCKAYAQLYQDSSTLWKPWIKDQIDMMFESFSQWNDVFGCNPPIVLTCDLEADGGGIGGADCNVEGNECETGYLCLSDGSCESEIVIDPNNKCTTDDGCGDDRKCETTEGFCYFSQCNNNGECTTQYGATSSCEKETKMYDNRVEYTTGSCQGSPVVDRPSVAGKSYGIFVVSVVVFGMALWV
eukprot:277552_1